MVELLATDRYHDELGRDCFKVCSYCDAPVNQRAGSTTVGLCARHEAIWSEDIQMGLHKQNRLKDLILKTKQP